MSEKNQVIVLHSGYAHSDQLDANTMRANCTCTLIRGKHGPNVIVDTMTAWDGASILAALAKHGLEAQDIDTVVCTHGHSDHIGCNYLFTSAKYHFVGSCVSQHDRYFNYFDDAKSYQLDEYGEIVVECTPGHTLSCVSVVVRQTQFDNGATVGICGDLFERRDDINDQTIWLDAGSEDPAAQRRERLRMAELCDYIVPGHGDIFAVNEEIRVKLRSNASKAV